MRRDYIDSYSARVLLISPGNRVAQRRKLLKTESLAHGGQVGDLRVHRL